MPHNFTQGLEHTPQDLENRFVGDAKTQTLKTFAVKRPNILNLLVQQISLNITIEGILYKK